MDRQIVYAGQIPLETDLLNTNRNAYTALGMLIQDMFGTNTVFSGLGCVPTSPAGMTVNVNPGRVYSLQQRDPTAYSSLGQDTTNQIMKQGVLLTATNFSCPAPATSGYSINYLISASFLEQDTNSVVLPYYNSTNPSQAFSGPPVNGQSSGTAQNTTRQDTIQLTLTAGVAATTGSQQTPATPTGQIALWVVTVAYGQTSITASSIAAVAGSPFAPTGGYFQAVGERYSSIINASASQTLTTAALGALVNVTATGTTQTLPAASACPNGTSVTIVYMQPSGSATVARNGTDTLSFGQGSSANSITLAPGEEVQFVSNGVNGWVSAGQTLSTGVTPPQFDNSTKLATTAALKAAGLQFSNTKTVSASTTLDASYVGAMTIVSGNTGPITLTLPSTGSQPIASTLCVLNQSSYAITLVRSDTGSIAAGGNAYNSITIGPGDTAMLASLSGSANSSWELLSGSTLNAFSPLFGSSLAMAGGYQKLPSGLIIQWGNIVTGAANTNYTWTFPIAFPNAWFGAWVGVNDAAGPYATGVTSTAGSVNKTSLQFMTADPGTSKNHFCVAIGY
ncbi:gp53-like domain-containing protein [Burkholderia multivorans]|uniref:gp53-like domain-containing protein n=1 Tax=Burkholderia multivorans TaxID=87883 RepID=UPI0021BF2099|nr:hypothetical protein [Burkholderia multivorans]